jgi:hypothetical protein
MPADGKASSAAVVILVPSAAQAAANRFRIQLYSRPTASLVWQ